MSESDLTEAGLQRHPVWKWDDAMEGYLPVQQPDPLPHDQGTLFIRARLVAASGEEFSGYLVGVEAFYAVGLFVMGQEFVLNLNLPDLIADDTEQIRALLGKPALQLFPLKYTDDVGFQHSPAIRGELSL
jgi:hypothetical protein